MKTTTNMELVPIDKLIPYVNNARTHSAEQITKIRASLREFGFVSPCLIDKNYGVIVGHGRIAAAKEEGFTEVPCVYVEHLTETQRKAYIIADNRLALDAGWDNELLSIELDNLKLNDFDLDILGFTQEDYDALLGDNNAGGGYESDGDTKGSLAERFLYPPFSVLDAKQGAWQNRKDLWIGCGLDSARGRGDNLLNFGSEFLMINSGTSIFDPVLTELIYLWFSGEDSVVIDPFAGGSVRGVIASILGRNYIGIDLQEEQVKANREQAEKMCDDHMPVWHVGDSFNIDEICSDVKADFMLTCPPYVDLEVYSDDPRDLSTMKYEDFRKKYFEIIRKACSLLNEDRFAAIVVGEVRDNKGNYYNFLGDTINAFLNAGMKYYNEMVLVTNIGSLPMRVGRQFAVSRKIGKTHQNVLIFVKGDGKKAAQYCGEVKIPDLEEMAEDESGE